jgi:hypothetical protein
MRSIKMTRSGIGGAILAMGLIVGTAPAQAATPAGVAGLGSAGFTKNGQTITIPPLPPCSVDAVTTSTSGSVVRTGITFGGGTSTCTRTVVNPVNNVTTTNSETVGKNFELSALVSARGPRIRIASYKINCSGSQSGTSATWSFSGMSGVSGLPAQIPTNYRHPVKKSDGTVLAEITFGEATLPNPPDGSIAMNMMHFRFTPASGISGEAIIGTTACSPTP